MIAAISRNGWRYFLTNENKLQNFFKKDIDGIETSFIIWAQMTNKPLNKRSKPMVKERKIIDLGEVVGPIIIKDPIDLLIHYRGKRYIKADLGIEGNVDADPETVFIHVNGVAQSVWEWFMYRYKRRTLRDGLFEINCYYRNSQTHNRARENYARAVFAEAVRKATERREAMLSDDYPLDERY